MVITPWSFLPIFRTAGSLAPAVNSDFWLYLISKVIASVPILENSAHLAGERLRERRQVDTATACAIVRTHTDSTMAKYSPLSAKYI
jgi:hypothetical protein